MSDHQISLICTACTDLSWCPYIAKEKKYQRTKVFGFLAGGPFHFIYLSGLISFPRSTACTGQIRKIAKQKTQANHKVPIQDFHRIQCRRVMWSSVWVWIRIASGRNRFII